MWTMVKEGLGTERRGSRHEEFEGPGWTGTRTDGPVLGNLPPCADRDGLGPRRGSVMCVYGVKSSVSEDRFKFMLSI